MGSRRGSYAADDAAFVERFELPRAFPQARGVFQSWRDGVSCENGGAVSYIRRATYQMFLQNLQSCRGCVGARARPAAWGEGSGAETEQPKQAVTLVMFISVLPHPLK